MRYPKYPEHVFPAPATPVVDAYVDYLRAYEESIMPPDQERQRQIQSLPPGNTRRASLLIGRACLLGKKGNETEKRLARKAHQEITPSTEVIGDVLTAIQQRNIARLIEHRDDNTQTATRRTNPHNTAIQIIQSSRGEAIPAQRQNSEISKRELIGHRGEARVVAGIGRLNHPWLFVSSALEHHDRHEGVSGVTTQRNFDVLVIESRPAIHENPGPFAYKSQVKSSCFGLCSRNEDVMQDNPGLLGEYASDRITCRREFDYQRSLYNSDISLISACCDFRPHNGYLPGTIDDLLIKEFSNQATPDEIDVLNRVSNHLLLTITGDPLRRGTFDQEVAGLPPAVSLQQQ